MTAFDPWDPYRDLRFAGTREHPEHGTCFIAEGRILVEDLLEAGRAGRLKVISVAARTSAAAGPRERPPAWPRVPAMSEQRQPWLQYRQRQPRRRHTSQPVGLWGRIGTGL